MLLQIITFSCVCDDFLKTHNHRDAPQTQMTTAEVMTCALVAAEFFCGNLRRACQYLKETGLIPTMLTESRFNRRLNRLTGVEWQGVLTALRDEKDETTFIVDSCPVPVCHLARASKSRLDFLHNSPPSSQREFRCNLMVSNYARGLLYAENRAASFGKCAAKDECFFGIKAHVVTAASGRPVEVLLLCGCGHDLIGLAELRLDLPEGAELLADKGYTDYRMEDRLLADEGIRLLALRKCNSKRKRPQEQDRAIRKLRKRIETTFSQVSTRLARRIHAVTEAGFESKVWAAFVAYAIAGVAS